MKFLREAGHYLIAGVKWGCVAAYFLEHVGGVSVGSGESMQPTLYTGDVFITEYISPARFTFRRGDIVTARCPTDPRHHLCKRIIALPGDKVDNEKTVPEGHLWLGGDNRSFSMDSWTFGPVPQALVTGRVICKVWPPRNMQMLTDRWMI